MLYVLIIRFKPGQSYVCMRLHSTHVLISVCVCVCVHAPVQ